MFHKNDATSYSSLQSMAWRGETRQRHQRMKSQQLVKRVYMGLVGGSTQQSPEKILNPKTENIYVSHNLAALRIPSREIPERSYIPWKIPPSMSKKEPCRGIESDDKPSVHDADPVAADDSLESVGKRKRKPTVFHSQYLRSRTHEQYGERCGLQTLRQWYPESCLSHNQRKLRNAKRQDPYNNG
jgi:hypothetical protein